MKRPTRHVVLTAGTAFLALVAALVLAPWGTPAASAGVGGYSQVTRLEIEYAPGDRAVEARFSLASGVALTQRFEDPEAIDHLLDAAEVFASEHSRLFVTAKDDRVVAWRLSVP